jgi:hypothetical protein
MALTPLLIREYRRWRREYSDMQAIVNKIDDTSNPARAEYREKMFYADGRLSAIEMIASSIGVNLYAVDKPVDKRIDNHIII